MRYFTALCTCYTDWSTLNYTTVNFTIVQCLIPSIQNSRALRYAILVAEPALPRPTLRYPTLPFAVIVVKGAEKAIDD